MWSWEAELQLGKQKRTGRLPPGKWTSVSVQIMMVDCSSSRFVVQVSTGLAWGHLWHGMRAVTVARPFHIFFFNSLTQLGEAMLVSADCICSLRSVSKHYNVQFYAVPPFKWNTIQWNYIALLFCKFARFLLITIRLLNSRILSTFSTLRKSPGPKYAPPNANSLQFPQLWNWVAESDLI